MDFVGFFQALLAQWVLLMSGTASVILSVVGFFRNWETTPHWAFGVIGLICFLLALVKTWTIEHEKVIEGQEKIVELERTLREQAYPALAGEIALLGIARPSDPYKMTSLVCIVASIRNTGMDSFVDGWEFQADLPDGRSIKAKVVRAPPESMGVLAGDMEVMYDPTDTLYKKLPVKRGDQISGTLCFEFDGLAREIIGQLGTTFTLSFKDVRGRQYTTPPRTYKGVEKDPRPIIPGTHPTIRKRTLP